MTPKKPEKKGAHGVWKPAGRVWERGEGIESGQTQKRLHEALREIGQRERAEAYERQQKAGIKNPIKTDFLRGDDVELEEALSKIWESGENAKRLSVKIGKGLTCLTRDDVCELGQLSCEEIEYVADDLIKGKTLKEAAE
jgi:hypothetical protein